MCRVEIAWPPGCLFIHQPTFVNSPGGGHACARITQCDSCVPGSTAVDIGVDDVDQRLLHRGTATLGALAPNADDSAVVGEADVADDGAQ